MTAVLIDASGYLYRAFYSQPLLVRSDGTPVGAVHGFCSMLWRLVRTHSDSSHFAVIFDHSRSAARIALYPEYKARRMPLPPEFTQQLGLLRETALAFGLPVIEAPGIEADDLLASYATALVADGATVTVVSSDKDLMQIMAPDIRLWCPMRAREVTLSDVLEKFGVPPSQVVDAQGLSGDATDNIPGLPRVGTKIAAELLAEFGTLDNVLNSADQIRKPALRRTIEQHGDLARLSRQLATLDRAVPLPIPLEELVTKPVDAQRLVAFMGRMEFVSLRQEVASYYGVPA